MQKIKTLFKRSSLSCYFSRKGATNYKIFSIIPSICITVDTQDTDFQDLIGSIEYSFYIEWLFWQFSITLNIKNRLNDSINN